MWQTLRGGRTSAVLSHGERLGRAGTAENEFLFQAHQVGWRLDRARFDAMLLAKAAERADAIGREGDRDGT